MKLTTEIVRPFIGGQAEILNRGEGYVYRGEIATAIVESNQLRITFVWLAKNVVSECWVKSDTHHDRVISLTTCIVEKIGPGTKGGDRLCIRDTMTGEAVVLFPLDGSNLNREMVVGLELVSA